MPANTHRWNERAPALLGLMASTLAVCVGFAQSQTTTPSVTSFEVASVKPCGSTAASGGGGREGGDSGSGSPPLQLASPGRVHVNCATLAGLVQLAYLTYENGQRHSDQHFDSVPIKGGPAWVYSDRYQLEAKAEGAPSEEVMLGPMLQALLEDRFKLKIGRETREIPVYELTVARGGPKIQPVQDRGCILHDISLRPPPVAQPGVNYCRLNMGQLKGRNLIVDTQAMTIDYFSKNVLMFYTDRPVIDKTGIAGLFDFHLEFAPDEATDPILRAGGKLERGEPSDGPAGISLFTALQQQLGLKLEPAKGNGYFVVIDGAERPSDN